MSENVLGNRYRMGQRIGIGGMAAVYEAEDTVLGRTVAVKIMLPQYASDPAFAMAGGFVRIGLAVGNSWALAYERAPELAVIVTPETCLGFMCLLAIVLIPLVRMEFSIVALTAAPPTKNEVEEICAEVAAEFALSARESEILLLIARGHTTSSMADKLVISPYTVNTHIRHIYDKMQIHKRSELLNYLNMQRSDF